VNFQTFINFTVPGMITITITTYLYSSIEHQKTVLFSIREQ